MNETELEVYSNGLCYCSICTNLDSVAMIENLVNLENPTGTSSRWKISKDPTFNSGDPNPCPCNQKPNTHKHYLLEC